MTTISLRVNDEDAKLIKEYTSVNNINTSSFIRELVLDKIEDELKLDEARILKALEKMKTEEVYDHTEVWERLDV